MIVPYHHIIYSDFGMPKYEKQSSDEEKSVIWSMGEHYLKFENFNRVQLIIFY